jgi:PHD/YefM family antitoxin component YafN of YafNO toxin-antitoxin module
MIELPLTEASQHLDRLRDQLMEGNASQTATLTEDGKPVLAVMPWELYETLMEMAYIPDMDPQTLLLATPETRQRILAVAAARAEALYRSDPDLTDFEAFGEEDLYDGAERATQ